MNLASTFVVLHPDQSATPVELTPTLYEELDIEGALFVTPGAGTEHKPVG